MARRIKLNLRFAGVVLCGGVSRRMGRDKAWIEMDGAPLLSRLVHTIGEVISPVVVAARPQQELPPLPDAMPVVRDAVPGIGPLGGLIGAFEYLDGAADALFVCAVDYALLKPSVIRAMLWHYEQFTGTASANAHERQPQRARLSPAGSPVSAEPVGADHEQGPLALIPLHQSRAQPLLAVYSIRCGDTLRALVAGGERRVQVFAETCRPAYIASEAYRPWDPELHSFTNINTPEDLDRIVHPRL